MRCDETKMGSQTILAIGSSPKYVSGLVTSAACWFAPVQPLICCALLFVSVDFVMGILASRKRARRRGQAWGFESRKAWKTVYKLVFILVGIVMCWLLDRYILTFLTLNLANVFTGFVCGIEFWSYLENAAEISEHPIFRKLKIQMKQRVGKELNER